MDYGHEDEKRFLHIISRSQPNQSFQKMPIHSLRKIFKNLNFTKAKSFPKKNFIEKKQKISEQFIFYI